MQPPQLLQETERAVGRPELLAQHQQLIRHKSDMNALEQSLAGDASHLANLQKLLAPLEEQVSRLQERREIEASIRMLKLVIPWEHYDAALTTYKEIKDRRNAIREQRENFELHLQPMVGMIETIRQERRTNSVQFEDYNKKYDDRVKSLNTLKKEIERSEDAQRAQQAKMKAAKQRQQKAIQNVQGLKAQIKAQKDKLRDHKLKLEKDGLLNENGEFDVSLSKDFTAVNESIERLEADLSNCRNAVESVKRRQREYMEEKMTYENRLARIGASIEALHEKSAQKLEQLRQASNAVYQVLEWFRMNDKEQSVSFEKQVFEPIYLQMNVTDSAYAGPLEQTIGRGNLLMDYHAFTRQAIDVMKKRINVVHLEHGDYRPPIPIDELKRMGFDGYLIDFIDAPKEILQVLCQLAHLHTIPVAVKPIANTSLVENDSRLRQYIVNGHMHQIKKAYGAQTVKINSISEPVMLKNSFNREEEARLESERNAIVAKIHDFQSNLATIERELSSLKQEETKLSEMKHWIKDIELLSKQKFMEEKLQGFRDKHAAVEEDWNNGIPCKTLLTVIVNIEWEEAKEKARSLKAIATRVTSEYTLEERQHMPSFKQGKTLAELEEMLAVNEARADLLGNGNDRAEHDYDRLKNEVAPFSRGVN
ncbi:Structural maintenance of chromosomes protein 5, partial [Phlyctochytrium bullatum]